MMPGLAMRDRVIIIGGGLAGLSAGVYAQRCGIETVLFEAHSKPGGVCTSWRRGPYLLDSGVRMVIGAAPPNPFHDLLCEVGVMHSVPFERIDAFHCIEDGSGERLLLHRDAGLLEEELRRAAPADAARVGRFIDTLIDFGRFRPPLDTDMELLRPRDGLAALAALRPVAVHFARWWGVDVARWLSRFRGRRLREAFAAVYPLPGFPVLAMFSSMGWFVGDQVKKPVLGAQSIADAVAGTYVAAGGEPRYSSRVESIIVDQDRAVGVRLEDGSEHRARAVVGAADGHATIFGMLRGRYMDAAVLDRYRDLPVFRPIVIVHLGVEMDLSAEAETIRFPLERPVRLPGGVATAINMHNLSGKPHAAPPGHSVLRVGLETSWAPWRDLAAEPGRYREEKERIASEVTDRLERRYPGIASAVRVRDVATPLTFVRYTGNWKAAYEGWQPSTRTFGMRMARTLPGLDGFYMTGQWVEPGGGVPAVVYSARRTVARIARDLGVRFTPWRSP
jgi:phytoene dehydrogenase-like protein